MPNQLRVGVTAGEAEGLEFLLERGKPVHAWRQHHLEDHRPGVGGDRLDNVRRVAAIERTAISDRPLRGQAREGVREIVQPARPSWAEGSRGDPQPMGHSDRVHEAQLSATALDDPVANLHSGGAAWPCRRPDDRLDFSRFHSELRSDPLVALASPEGVEDVTNPYLVPCPDRLAEGEAGIDDDICSVIGPEGQARRVDMRRLPVHEL
jgi:hypothetical protein